FTRFGLAVMIDKNAHDLKRYDAAVAALLEAAKKLSQKGKQIERIHILGGLCNTHTLARNGISAEGYLQGVAQRVSRVKSEVESFQGGKPIELAVDGGDYLLGHTGIIADVTGVKIRADGKLVIHIRPHSYADFVFHSYFKEPIYFDVLPRPAGQE